MHPTIHHITDRLRGLPPTARLLVVSIVVILAMALFLVSLYAGRRDLVPLGLKTELEPAARAEALAHLERRGIPFEVQGTQILVPPEQTLTLLAELTDGDVITAAQIDFDALIENDSPFRSRAQNERRWLIATMNVLSRTISRLDGIERATVVIDEPGRPGGLGAARVPPSASVNVIPRGAPLTQDQVDAIAALVAGAHAELTPEQVAVVDARAGRSYRAREESAMRATTHLEIQDATEQRVQEKLEAALAYIPGVNVAVHVAVDTREETQRISTYEQPQTGVVSETTTSRSIPAWGGVLPGINPTDTIGMLSSANAPAVGTEDASTAELETRFPSTERNVRDPKGYALQINATIGVPKSYFTRLQAEQPEAAALDMLIRTETERIRAQIEPLVDTSAIEGAVAGTVAVSMIPDFVAIATRDAAMPLPAVTTSDFASSESLLRYLGLGGLALLSVLLMAAMLRRAGAPSARRDVADADGVLETPEITIDERSAVTSEIERIIREINDRARTSPREAAFLLRRWMAVDQ